MNSFERYISMIKGQPVDHLPRVPILMQYAAEYIGSNYGEFASDYNVLVKANEQCAIDFGFDQLSCISDPYRETQGFGSEVTYVKDGPPRSTHPLEFDKDISKLLKPDPYKSERMLDRIRAVREYDSKYKGEYSILGWVEGPAAEAADLRNVMNFLMDLMGDEAYAEELMDICVETGIAFAKAQVKAGADTIGIGDAIASQISPQAYEKLIQPREKRIVDAIHAAGGYAKLHICGDITHLLLGVSDLGIDIIDVDYMVDLKIVRRLLGNKVVITGNLDPVSMIKNETPATIQEAKRDAFNQAGKPFMVNAGCEIPSGTPVENLRALCTPLS